MTAYLLVTAGTYYLGVGLMIAMLFAALVQRVEPSASGGSILFRLLIVPGATLLWPLIVVRSLRALRRAS
ncbi:MAG TPA: hypothetical protein VJR89_32940 [Polyangiales bacterium]|nr:hypothetical protein [Polyangiales bacterium]